jgi:hypothetical protein
MKFDLEKYKRKISRQPCVPWKGYYYCKICGRSLGTNPTNRLYCPPLPGQRLSACVSAGKRLRELERNGGVKGHCKTCGKRLPTGHGRRRYCEPLPGQRISECQQASQRLSILKHGRAVAYTDDDGD